MDTGAAGASDSTGGASFPPAGSVPAKPKARPPPVPGLKGKAPGVQAKPFVTPEWTGKGKAPPTPPPPPAPKLS
eukprot:4692042-Heterocapsa_arctica.AAC.1